MGSLKTGVLSILCSSRWFLSSRLSVIHLGSCPSDKPLNHHTTPPFNTIVWLVYSYFSLIILHPPTERIDSLCLDIQSRGNLNFFLFCSLWVKPLLRSHISRSWFVLDSFRVVCHRRCSCSGRQSLHTWRSGIDPFDIWCKRFHWLGLQTVLDCIRGRGKHSNCDFCQLLLVAWVEGVLSGDLQWWDHLIGWREPPLGPQLMLETESLSPFFHVFFFLDAAVAFSRSVKWRYFAIDSKF